MSKNGARVSHTFVNLKIEHGLRTFFWGKDETTSQLLQDLEKSLVLLGSLIGDATYVNSQKTQEDIYQIKRHQEREHSHPTPSPPIFNV